MKRTILITNDDGPMADGLRRLAVCAREFGDVWIVAPEAQRSAASHSITLHDTLDVHSFDFGIPGVRGWVCSGSPADCVRVAVHYLLPARPDVVLSGINDGSNAGTDLQYSATAGAVFEAAFQGITGISLSERAAKAHGVTDLYLSRMLERYIDEKLPWDEIFNINFPSCDPEKCKGVLTHRLVSSGTFYHDTYKKTADLEDGGIRLMVHGTPNEDAGPQDDITAIVHGYISVGRVRNVSTPLRP